MTPEQTTEWLVCAESASYFCHTYGQIYDAQGRAWVPFALWPAQYRTLRTLQRERLTIVLKARQLGLTWLLLGYALWLMLFQPGVTVLLFSRRDDEAVELLSFRLKGVYARLPAWLRATVTVITSNDHAWELSCGSRALAFPTSAGDSYTASLAIVDEADLVPDLGRLMRAVKPTIDGGGQMILLSRVDKGQPQSEFKRIYRAARNGENGWTPVFLPWHARPERDAAWYDAQRRDVLARTSALDDLHEQYPATDTEALAPRSLDKRLPGAWLEACYTPGTTIAAHGAPALPGLAVYQAPQPGCRYAIGADPAEGNPTSDDSAATVVEMETGHEVAALAGKFEPAIFASYVAQLARWYNRAGLLVERNNHGHAVLLWLQDNTRATLLAGHDGKVGWLSNSKGKALLYDSVADALRSGNAGIVSFATYLQLAAVEGATLRAPQGEMDDRADSYALSQAARTARPANALAVPLLHGSAKIPGVRA